jgi:uncharacterized protein YukE
MTRFAVSLTALDELLERIASFDRALELRLARVAAAAGVLATTWSGTAASSYAAAHAACTRDLDDMRAALTRMRGAVATARANYSSALATNARMWAD